MNVDHSDSKVLSRLIAELSYALREATQSGQALLQRYSQIPRVEPFPFKEAELGASLRLLERSRRAAVQSAALNQIVNRLATSTVAIRNIRSHPDVSADFAIASQAYELQLTSASQIAEQAIDVVHELGAARERLIPPQKPAPIRVRIKGERLRISNPKGLVGSIKREAVERIRSSAAETLRAALGALKEAHNTDRRIAPALEPLLKHLSTRYDDLSIEALGLTWRIASNIVDEFRDELPDIARIQLEQALATINVIVNQYEEWRAYLAAEAASSISVQDADRLIAETSILSETLAKSPNSIDPEIVARLNAIIDPVANGLIGSEAIIVPLIASLSNIFAGASEIVLTFAPTFQDGVSRKGAAFLALLIAFGLLKSHSGRLAQFPPLAFIKDAYEHTIRHFPWLKDTIFK